MLQSDGLSVSFSLTKVNWNVYVCACEISQCLWLKDLLVSITT